VRNDMPDSLLFGQSRSMFLSYFFLPAERRLLPASLSGLFITRML
jgi:hypothetical protein